MIFGIISTSLVHSRTVFVATSYPHFFHNKTFFMNWKTLAFAACLVSSVALVSCERDNDDDGKDNETKLNDTDRHFMLKTSISNTAEVGTATLALNRANNPAVLAFAQQMIAEHTVAQVELKALGVRVGYPVKDTLDPRNRAILDQLQALSGRAFDSVYIHTQVVSHQATLANFENELDNGRNSNVKDYASKYRPHIEHHLEEAETIATTYFPR